MAMALSISCAMTANFFFLVTILYRKLDGFSLAYLVVGLGKVLAAATGMGVFLHGMWLFLAGWMQQGLLAELTSVLILILSGASFYGSLLYLFNLPEFKMIIDKLRGRV